MLHSQLATRRPPTRSQSAALGHFSPPRHSSPWEPKRSLPKRARQERELAERSLPKGARRPPTTGRRSQPKRRDTLSPVGDLLAGYLAHSAPHSAAQLIRLVLHQILVPLFFPLFPLFPFFPLSSPLSHLSSSASLPSLACRVASQPSRQPAKSPASQVAKLAESPSPSPALGDRSGLLLLDDKR